MNESTVTPSEAIQVRLWNPAAAATWSLVFTPAFGAYLQMLNWRALGNSEEAAKSRQWFHSSIMFILTCVLAVFLLPKEAVTDGAFRGAGLTYLLVWYFMSGRQQASFVSENYGEDYQRRPWTQPLLIAVGGMLATVSLSFVLSWFQELLKVAR